MNLVQLVKEKELSGNTRFDLAVIDADSLLYRAGFANEKREYWVWDREDMDLGPVRTFKYKKQAKGWINGEDERYFIEKITSPGSLSEATSYLDRLLRGTLNNLKPLNRQIFISSEIDGETFRHREYSEYKATRDTSNKPVHYKLLRYHIFRNWNAAIVSSSIEADDAVAMSIARAELEGRNVCCVSIDKDLDQIPGHHYNPNKRISYFLTEEEALTNLYVQALEGDTSDNIEGVRGIGKKTASKLLEPCKGDEKEMYKVCLGMYMFDYVRLNKNLRLLYLLRSWGDEWEPPMTIEEIASEASSN